MTEKKADNSIERALISQNPQNVDVNELANELMYRRFLTSNREIQHFFKELTGSEYIALKLILKNEKNDPIYGGKTYLSDLAERLQRPMKNITKLARSLRDKGLVIWKHDGDGEQGTYVTITDDGRKITQEHSQVVQDFYGKVIQQFGQQNLMQLLDLMKQLETIMTAELETYEADHAGKTAAEIAQEIKKQ